MTAFFFNQEEFFLRGFFSSENLHFWVKIPTFLDQKSPKKVFYQELFLCTTIV